MDLFQNISNFPNNLHGGVIAIGNFDGLHRGHCALIGAAAKIAAAHNVPLGILTFEPHPRTLFQAPSEPFRLTPPPLKRERAALTSADFMVELPFNRELAQLSAADFIQNILVESLHASHIVVGEDFRFGQGRTGDITTLAAQGEIHGFGVTPLSPVQNETSQTYSASTIRSLLRRGAVAEADAMLGWKWEIRGEVVHGDKRGRELGYPTANVPLKDTLHPSFGIYATWVRIEGEDTWRPAATNIGIRPMFETKTALVEAHLLDYEGDLYGKTLHIRLVRKIRDEAKFDNLEALVAQMEKDCATATRILAEDETAAQD